MGNVLIEEDTMTLIADAIREKRGTTDLLLPSQMPQEILEIQTGSALVDETLPIRFFDYDGTLLYSYSLEALQEMSELPPLPSQEGLICEGWNWTLEDLKATNREMNVSVTYITDDGATRLYVSIDEYTLEPRIFFNQSKSDAVKVDWGDGSPLETSTETEAARFHHTYEEPGEYVIRFLVEDGCTISLFGSNTYGGYTFCGRATEGKANTRFFSAVRKIEMGRNVELMDSYCLSYFGRLECISLSNTIGKFGNGMVSYCYSLKFLTLPNGIISISSYTCQNCEKLQYVSIPNGVKNIYTSAFEGCHSLKQVTLPDGLSQIESYAFRSCYRFTRIELPTSLLTLGRETFGGNRLLEGIEIQEGTTVIPNGCFDDCCNIVKFVIPASVVTLETRAFEYCKSVVEYYFFPKMPPTMDTIAVFSGIHPSCKIYVPVGSLGAYQTATNWSRYASYIVEMEAST